MKLSLTYSAFREMEQIPQTPLREITEAILALAEDPLPATSAVLEDQGGCLYIPVGEHCIVYHIGEDEHELTVLGVVDELTLCTVH